MERPRDDTTTDDLLDHANFTCAAVAADPEVAGLEAPLAAGYDQLRTTARAEEDKRAEVVRYRAKFLMCDGACDRIVRWFELRLYALVNKDRDNPDYRRYFKDSVTTVTDAEPRHAEPAMVAEMITACADDAARPGIGPIAVEFRPLLQSALDAVKLSEGALAAREAELHYLHDKTLFNARTHLVDEYVKLHGALKSALPRDPKRVEAFFQPFRKPRKKADASPEPAKPPADGATTATNGAPPAATTTPAAGTGTTP